MDAAAVLAAYDEQVRRRAAPGGRIERDDGVVRSVGTWNGVGWSALHPDRADAVIAAQVARFRELGVAWEWKHHSHDPVDDLPERLLAAGFTAGGPETLLVAEAAALPVDAPPPAGVELVPVVDAAGVDALVAVHDAVFGGDHSAVGRTLLRSAGVEAVLAVADGGPVSAGRIEFVPGTEFAGLWGGGTLPGWRGRGVFRALVAFRAARAVARGYRYVQVDATADSRPILLGLGFSELATTTPYLHD
ncbi:GNAT family N-acetyltransferase [Pseudonocardia abyssalis]|uniref:GNAT family N-acetyltransferase n=1 Tax=Pseudonocardia abyssalis TaxID=2792008 RepID=A0ABS6UUP9_9PSEU|nr:GNAT family N-acetyltransferase [Pseudonocardia abyssalis]MBW0135994.1 GNAT family N-acetyltransferase [Pseudonocardia abyssalis]